MFQRKIYLDNESYIEVSTRIYNKQEMIMITLSGKKNESEKTMSSAIMTEAHATLFCDSLKEALNRETSWPPKEED